MSLDPKLKAKAEILLEAAKKDNITQGDMKRFLAEIVRMEKPKKSKEQQLKEHFRNKLRKIKTA
jgi:hypothetical protein